MNERGQGSAPVCPLPRGEYPHVLLAHGGGGRLMHQLIEKVFVASFAHPCLAVRHDSAEVIAGGARLAFTTDSYVVDPLFFPGGDIGSLAVHGTVNDLAMSGARPLYLSAGFIIEEGLPVETLWRIAQSMAAAARSAQVGIVAGDTKVVERGKGDGVFINTAGIGVIEHGLTLAPQSVRPGDAILINGDVGRHGIVVLSKREGLAFETTIESDSAALAGDLLQMLDAGVEIHCLRDLTRGGLATALNEIAAVAQLDMRIEERAVPVAREVGAACEILGLDPLYVACEGRFVAFVAPHDADRAAAILNAQGGAECARIGEVLPRATGQVTLTGRLGAARLLDLQSGEQLPRIC